MKINFFLGTRNTEMYKSNKHRGKMYFEIPGGNYNEMKNETEIMLYERKCNELSRFERTLYCEACLKRDLNNCTPSDFQANETPADLRKKLGIKTCPATTCSNLSFNPCMNGGTCLNLETNEMNPKMYVQFKCECASGYSGLLCLSFRPCEFKPCKSGECVEIGDLGLFYCVTENEWINGLEENAAMNLLFIHFNAHRIFCWIFLVKLTALNLFIF
jgi:hypothetical protein